MGTIFSGAMVMRNLLCVSVIISILSSLAFAKEDASIATALDLRAYTLAVSIFDGDDKKPIVAGGPEHLKARQIVDAMIASRPNIAYFLARPYLTQKWDSAHIPFNGFDSISREIKYTDEAFKGLSSRDYRLLNYITKGLEGCRAESLTVPVEELDYKVDSYSLDDRCKAQLAKDLAAEGFAKVIIENRNLTDRSGHSDLQATVTFTRPERNYISSFAPILDSRASTKVLFSSYPHNTKATLLTHIRDIYGFNLDSASVKPDITEITFTMKIGWGDCVESCTYNHIWTGTVRTETNSTRAQADVFDSGDSL
jgi:hypothetical protein